MTCTSCGDKPKGSSKGFPRAVVEINNPESLVLLRKVVIPVSMGTEEDVPPTIGKYFNVILQYESNGHIYLYSSDGIPTAIEANIPQEVLDRIGQLEIDVDVLETGLANEVEARETADTALGGRIDTVADNLATETANRISADEDLQADIAAEATARANADTALNTAITAEATARQTADAGLQSQIDAITASSDVKDIVGTKAELNNYDTSTLGNNDIIKVLQDESENNATTYYRWNATTQQFTLIGEEGPYYTKSQADTLLNAKQNTLTAGSNVQINNNVISATDTTYSDFTGTDGSSAGAAGLVPAPATTDAGKFLKADGTWDTAGSAINVVQATGTSTTDVMSQNAVTSMVFADPSTKQKIKIGDNTSVVGSFGVGIGYGANAGSSAGVAVGYNAKADTNGAVAIIGHASGSNSLAFGYNAKASGTGSIAIGSNSSASSQGEINVGTSNTGQGYSSSNYRLLTGLYDPQSDHDAATKGYVDTAVAGAGASAFTTNEWNALWA